MKGAEFIFCSLSDYDFLVWIEYILNRIQQKNLELLHGNQIKKWTFLKVNKSNALIIME